MGLASTFVNTVRSFDRANFPISCVRNSQVLVLATPVGERGIEDTIISCSIVSLFLELWSPQVTMSGPWSIILVFAPWVSHLDKSLMLRTIWVVENKTSKTSFSMSIGNMEGWVCSSSTNHWVVVVHS